uniref:Uncharacterized protein n=1 Tax=Glossina palpalis gambiensis TaxID=67801 RepID=A0A1B0AM29_9MUSC
MPKQPFRYCMLPLGGRYENIEYVPNPYDCFIDEMRVLETLGQNIGDLLRTPTAQDTLTCYPYISTERICPVAGSKKI